MILSSSSQYMLKYQKAKAKLVEHEVDKVDYPNFPLNSNELSYPTIYIISRYVESIVENDEASRAEFSMHLELASQYFDAAVNSEDREEHDLDFLLSGATAYFLSDDFGSAKVLCSKIEWSTASKRITPQSLLINLYNFILLGRKMPATKSRSIIATILKSIDLFFQSGEENEDLPGILLNYRDLIYENGDLIDIYYVDIFIAIVQEAIKKSAWYLLPKYSQNSIDEWREYLERPNAIKILWPSQQLIGENDILLGENAIIQLPTGVGKTRSIELIIRAAFLAERASTAVIVAPLRALCNEITSDLIQAFGDEVIINQFSDVLQEDFLFDLSNFLKKRIIICTPEKLIYIMHHQVDILAEIDLFIFDEGHMFDDGTRGVLYELLISEIRSQITKSKQLVLLSAVLSNAEQIKEWLLGEAGKLATSDKIKATPKSIGFTSKTKDINYFSDNPKVADFYVPKSLTITQLKKLNRERAERYFPIMSDAKDIAIYYALKLCHNGGVAIYVNRTDSVLTVIRRVLDLHDREYDFSKLSSVTNGEHVEKVYNLIKEYYGEEHEFSRAAIRGIFPHYADLPNGIKLAIEYAIRHDQIRFVVCTSTLAQGVNIPIKFLFMTSFRLKQNSMQIRNFQNLIGRTARSGIYTEGSVVVTETNFYDQRTDRRHGGNYRWNDCIKMFDPNAAEPCSSSILSLVKDIVVDYETSFKGKGIAKFIIDNYEQSDCFENLLKKLSAGFLKLSPEKDPKAIVPPVMYRKSIIDSIENHLCYLYSNSEWVDFEDHVEEICKETLAYALANESEKNLLISLFLVISRKVDLFDNKVLIQRFARTMVGIDLSRKIEDWISENDIQNVFYTEEELFDMIVLFFLETYKIKTSFENFNLLCKAWISDEMFEEMEAELDSRLNISSIEETCSKSISYQLSFFIGNIIDMLDIDTENQNEVNLYLTLNELQKKIRYGVSSQTSIVICDMIFNDRFLANKLAKILGESVKATDIVEVMKQNFDEIEEQLSPFPAYFLQRVKKFIE